MSKKDLIPVKKGQVLNPKGRGKGVRNKLSNTFLTDLNSYWDKIDKSGTRRAENLLDRAAEKDPMAFCKMIASIIPKELHKENHVQVSFVEALKSIQGDDAIDITPSEDKEDD